MSLAAIREAIAAAVESTGLVQSTAYVTDQANHPQAMVVRGEIIYNRTFDPTHAYEFMITVYVTRQSQSGQELLDELAEPEGPTSIKEAVENDVGLKELIQYAEVVSASPATEAVVGETQYLAATFLVRVVA